MYLISTRILITMSPSDEYVYGNDRIVVDQINRLIEILILLQSL